MESITESTTSLLALFLTAYIFILASTPLHELMHLIAAKLCGVRVLAVKFFCLSKIWRANSVLGYVVLDNSSYQKKYQVYFVDLAGGWGCAIIFGLISAILFLAENYFVIITSQVHRHIVFSLTIAAVASFLGGVREVRPDKAQVKARADLLNRLSQSKK